LDVYQHIGKIEMHLELSGWIKRWHVWWT